MYASKTYHIHEFNKLPSDEDSMCLAFGVLETVSFIIGVPGSAIILTYFVSKSKDKSVSTFLYIWISSTDLILCLLTFASAVSDFKSGEAAMFGNKYFCNITGFLWGILAKMSIFLIAVLSIARTISITFPFFKVKRLQVAILVSLYLSILVFEYSLPFIFNTKDAPGGYYYMATSAKCRISISQIFDKASVPFWILYYWTTFGNLLLPLPVVIISCCVTVYQLRDSGSEVPKNEGGNIKKEATITVLILTGIYIVFNAPLCLHWILHRFSSKNYNHTEQGVFGKYHSIYLRAIKFNSIEMNSVCNVVVYFCRMKDLRQYVRNMVRNIREN